MLGNDGCKLRYVDLIYCDHNITQSEVTISIPKYFFQILPLLSIQSFIINQKFDFSRYLSHLDSPFMEPFPFLPATQAINDDGN